MIRTWLWNDLLKSGRTEFKINLFETVLFKNEVFPPNVIHVMLRLRFVSPQMQVQCKRNANLVTTFPTANGARASAGAVLTTNADVCIFLKLVWLALICNVFSQIRQSMSLQMADRIM